MKSQDWHEALKSLTFADTASGQEVCEKSTGAEDKAVTVQKSPIHIVLERKGRAYFWSGGGPKGSMED